MTGGDYTELVERLEVLAAWHKPAGDEPTIRPTNKYKAFVDAADAIKALEAQLATMTGERNRTLNLAVERQVRAERAEFERDDANRLLKQGLVAAHQPDPLGEALNSGDGSYRP